jgi:hypothetical protein
LVEHGFHWLEGLKGHVMKRFVTAIPLLALIAALLSLGGPATAAPPTPVDQTLTFKAGEACQFPIQVALTGKQGSIALPNNPIFFFIAPAPNQRVTVTNLKTGETITVNATGTFRFVTLPDGGTQIVAGGQNFLFGEPQVGAGALATTGPIEVLVDENFEIVAMDLSGARVRDICAELA